MDEHKDATSHVKADQDGFVHGYDITPFDQDRWVAFGESLAKEAQSCDDPSHVVATVTTYLQAVGLLFLQNNLEQVAALRLGWRQGGGRDYAADFNQNIISDDELQEVLDAGLTEETGETTGSGTSGSDRGSTAEFDAEGNELPQNPEGF